MLPQFMKALKIFPKQAERVQLVDVPVPNIRAGYVLVKVLYAALNRRDQWIREGKYPRIQEAILGSDACGVVVEATDTDKHWLNKEVLINPNNLWGDDPRHQSADYHILGMPTEGTFAEYVCVPTDRIQRKPIHLTAAEASALPLGGLTAYRAVFTHGQVQEGTRTLITGVGGGVAQFAFQFAKAAGAATYATSGDEAKIAQIQKMGAKAVFNYKNAAWLEELAKEASQLDVIVDSAGGEQFAELVKVLGRSGRLVFYGATNGLPSKIDLHRMFFNQISIHGSTMGNDHEFTDMLDFVTEKKIKPVISSVRPFEEIISALDEMKQGKQFGKLVVEMKLT